MLDVDGCPNGLGALSAAFVDGSAGLPNKPPVAGSAGLPKENGEATAGFGASSFFSKVNAGPATGFADSPLLAGANREDALWPLVDAELAGPSADDLPAAPTQNGLLGSLTGSIGAGVPKENAG